MEGEGYIRRDEHQEFAKRMEEENHRQNKRLDVLESTVKDVHSLTVSVEKLAVSMESMLKEQESQGKRLKELESRDGEMWRKVLGLIITALVSGAVGFVLSRLGM